MWLKMDLTCSLWNVSDICAQNGKRVVSEIYANVRKSAVCTDNVNKQHTGDDDTLRTKITQRIWKKHYIFRTKRWCQIASNTLERMRACWIIESIASWSHSEFGTHDITVTHCRFEWCNSMSKKENQNVSIFKRMHNYKPNAKHKR